MILMPHALILFSLYTRYSYKTNERWCDTQDAKNDIDGGGSFGMGLRGPSRASVTPLISALARR